jgi:putative phosphoribosyl transferase
MTEQTREQSRKKERIVRIPVPAAGYEKEALKILEGNLTIPSIGEDNDNNNKKNAKGVIIFAHGSGSSHHSLRNQFVAHTLNSDGLATLLVDLLTKEEQETDIKTQKIQNKIPGLVQNKFNIKLLSNRLLVVTDWVLANNETCNMTIGYFGASTGAAAALVAAAERTDIVAAIVSRGGRPDLASPVEILSRVEAPTLLIVGGNDRQVIDLNNKALHLLANVQSKKVVIVPKATHLFKEAGTLEEVARLACGWFRCIFQIKENSTSNNIQKQQEQ